MNSKKNLFLAIDQSTSATKALLVDLRGNIVGQQSVHHKQIYPKPGWVEHDPEEILSNSYESIKRLLEENADARQSILALSITNQRETFVIFDRKTGKPLHNAIVWQCQRGDEICNSLLQLNNNQVVHSKTGLKIDTYFPASKIRWLIESNPDIRQKIKDGSALFGTIDTFLVYRFTNGKVYATDHTNASRTLFFDIKELDWDQGLCQLFGLEFAELPEIRESCAVFGETSLNGLLDKPTQICGVIGDSQAALFAQHCYDAGDTKITFGTGSSILLNIGQNPFISDQGNLTALGWVYNTKPTYAFEGIVNFSGATIAWFKDQLELIDNVADTETLARSVSDTNGVYFVPAFSGLSAPYWRNDIRAAILGISLATTRAHVIRAALESIGFIVSDALQAMIQESNSGLSKIYADGGATKNTFLMQFVADINQIPIQVSQTAELSAMGAVFNGMLGMGVLNSLEQIQQIPNSFIDYNPIMNSAQAALLFSNWKSAVQQLLYKP